MVEILARSGVRVSELCDVRLRHVRLHDADGARFRIPDAKTEAGIREVQMTPDLVEALVEHLDRLRRAGQPTGPDAFLSRTARRPHDPPARRQDRPRGGRARQRGPVARGLPPLPNTTPHSMRRTYISIALLANDFDVKWVMSQVGHADSTMTMDVYAQLEQRVDREHGTAFDRLVRHARESSNPDRARKCEGLLSGHGLGHECQKRFDDAAARAPPTTEKADLQGVSADGETRIRTGDTTIFSRVLYQLSYLAVGRPMLAIRGP